MSIENLKSSELNLNQIDIVTGGDNGDVESEWALTREAVKPRYSVGQYVEVYNTGVHITTKRGQITSVKIVCDEDWLTGPTSAHFPGYYYPLYTVYVIEDNESIEVTSNQIES